MPILRLKLRQKVFGLLAVLLGTQINSVNPSFSQTDGKLSKVSSESRAVDSHTKNSFTGAQNSTSFPDVSLSHWAYPYIQGLAERGTIEGYKDGRFRPEEPMTRAEFATLISRAFSLSIQNPLDFSDVDQRYWAFNAIREANRSGFLNGYDNGQFRPDQNIKRYEVIISLASGLEYLPSNDPLEIVSFYEDGYKTPTWLVEKTASATEKQIIVNYPDARQLDLEQVATRAEVASMLYRALADLDKVPSISSNFVSANANIMETTINREEVCGDAKIKSYLNELRGFLTPEFSLRPVAYQALINCGRQSTPHLINELKNTVNHAEIDIVLRRRAVGYPYNYLYHYYDYRTNRPTQYFSILSTALVQIGAESVPTLVSELSVSENQPSVNYDPAVQALYSLYSIGPSAIDAVPEIVEHLNQVEANAELTTWEEEILLDSIALVEPAIAVDKLQELLQKATEDEDHDSIREITGILGRIGPDAISASKTLLEIVNNPNAWIDDRISAAEALSLMKAEASEVIPFLIEHTQSDEFPESFDLNTDLNTEEVNESAVRVLGNYGALAKESIPTLVSILRRSVGDENPDWEFGVPLSKYWRTIEALGNIGFSDSEYSEEIVALLAKIMARDPDINAFPYGLSSTGRNLSCVTTTVLSQQEQALVEPAMQELLSNQDPQVRALASHVMLNFKPEMLPILVNNLSLLNSIFSDSLPDETDWHPFEDCYGIADYGPIELAFSSSAIPTLISAVDGNNEAVRTFAAYGLAGIRDLGDSETEVVFALVRALKTGDAFTRSAAAEALGYMAKTGRVASRTSSNALLMALDDSDSQVRHDATIAFLRVNNIHPSIVYAVHIGQGGGSINDFFIAIRRFFEEK